MEEPATAPTGMLKRWESRILFGVAFIAGLAAFLSNLDKIGDILGLTKAQPLKVALLTTNIGFDGGAGDHPGDWILSLNVIKSGPGSARHCKIEIQTGGVQMTIRGSSYRESFSLPDGDVVREVSLLVIPFGPDRAFYLSDDVYPIASIFCDNVASQELKIPVPRRYQSHDPKDDR